MKKLIVLLGPTGVGKTELSLSVAKQFNTEIVSTDSRQLFGDLEIGTAAPTAQQMQKVKHHMVGHLDVEQYYNASQYETDALVIIEKLHQTHEYVVATGGSMMYIDALCEGIDKMPDIDSQLRNDLKNTYDKEGLSAMQARLKVLDPEFYEEVDLKNPKRVIHALEICIQTGKTYTSFRTETKKKRPFQIIKIGLNREREELYRRINHRVDIMIEDGLIHEARQFYPKRKLNALNTVGYKEMFAYIDGEWELDEAIAKIKQNSRNYARKQLSWFRRDDAIHWIDLSTRDEKQALTEIIQILK